MFASNNSFCSNQSFLLKEELIGTALLNKVYVLIECRTPWSNEAFDSREISQRLSFIVENYRKSARFLLISNSKTKQTKHRQVLFYVRSSEHQFSNGFTLHKAECPDYDSVCEIIENYFLNQQLPPKDVSLKSRNILICTHGSFDRCCGKYGKPFYMKSQEILHNINTDEKIQVWESSHFGGHRFAPTMIDFPDGRYYGRLTEDIFAAIINRSGDLNKTASSYRGWGILPKVAQVVEKQLLLDIGWQWFNASISGIVNSLGDGILYDVEIRYLLGYDQRICSGRVSKNHSQSLTMKIRCQNKAETRVPQFSLDSLEYL